MLHPLNKHLVVEPINEEKKSSGVLIPDDVRVEESSYKLVRLLRAHSECSLYPGVKLVVPTHMLEEVEFLGNVYYLILENYVVGFFEDTHED
tara:strand:- start:306 stop:581 length:276 start_codon:yes stop_codon:yes gene_type:complete